MANGAELTIRITGNSKKFRAELDKVEKKAKKTTNAIKKTSKVAARALAASLAVLAAGVTASVKAFAEFEASFTKVITLLDEGSFATKTLTQGIDDLKNGVLALRAETGESFDNLNKGLFDLISAGVDAADSIKVLRVAANLATSGATDTSVAVDGLTSALNAFELSADSAQEISDKFFTAQKFGKTTVEELSRGFGLVASTASSFGVSLDELLASVAAVTTGGVRTSQAYTGLAAIFANISKPTKDATDEAERLGVEFTSTALRAQGFEGFLRSITESAKFNSTTLENLFGSVEAVKTILALTGAGADDFAKILLELADTEKAAATNSDALAKSQNTLEFQSNRARGAISALAVKIGAEFSPAIKDASRDIADFVEENDNKIIFFMNRIALFMGFFASTIGDTVTSIFKSFLGAFERFAADIFKGLAATISAVQNLGLKFGIDIGGQEALADIRGLGAKLEAAAQKNLEEGSIIEFSKRLGERLQLVKQANQNELDALELREEKKAELLAESNEKLEVSEEERAERKRLKDESIAQAEKDAADKKREEQLEKEDEEFEEDQERLEKRLVGVDEAEQRFSGLKELRLAKELQSKARTNKQKEEADKLFNAAEDKLGQSSLDSSLDRLQILVGEESKAGKAIFLIKQAQALASAIVNTSEAVTEALPNLPLAAIIGVAGGLEIATIAATAFSGAQQGGVVQGGVFGRDTEPFLLARDEIILPSQVNPLSPNFDETFGGGLGNQEVTVRIDLSDEASQFITVGQREDTTLGVQR